MNNPFTATPNDAHTRHALFVEVGLASALAGVAGALNVMGFMIAGVFSANMTGNVTSLADQFGGGDAGHGVRYLTIVLLFVAGATFAALMLELVGSHRRARACIAILVAEALLLVALDGADHLASTHRADIMVYGLSFLMGLQNAMAARVSHARLRTTHVSGTSTDIGVGVGVIIAQLCKRGSLCQEGGELQDLLLRVATVGAFCLGGLTAAVIYPYIGERIVILAALVLLGYGVPCLFQYTRVR
ncbi:YoaK family protein [Paraburkholderia sp. BR14263]|uniref:YoaK family protein n=1 Tax=unclassified Paraburkholderia TaxID=2615204 RepID=UPI0034D00B90